MGHPGPGVARRPKGAAWDLRHPLFPSAPPYGWADAPPTANGMFLARHVSHGGPDGRRCPCGRSRWPMRSTQPNRPQSRPALANDPLQGVTHETHHASRWVAAVGRAPTAWAGSCVGTCAPLSPRRRPRTRPNRAQRSRTACVWSVTCHTPLPAGQPVNFRRRPVRVVVVPVGATGGPAWGTT